MTVGFCGSAGLQRARCGGGGVPARGAQLEMEEGRKVVPDTFLQLWPLLVTDNKLVSNIY